LALTSLANTLDTRYLRTGARSDIDEAIDVHWQAVAASTDNHSRALVLANLGNALRIRLDATGAEEDFDEAADVLQQAVVLAGEDTLSKVAALVNYALTLMSHHAAETVQGETDSRVDLDAAIASLREAAAVPGEIFNRTAIQFNLASALWERFARTGEQACRDEAISLWEQAARDESAPPSQRIRAARQAAGNAAAHDPSRAAHLMESAVRLLPSIAPRSSARSDQQHALSRFEGLAADAAALSLQDDAASAADRPSLALRLLEMGRGVLLTQSLQVRSGLKSLGEQQPALAERFIRLRALLDTATFPIDAATSPLQPDGIRARSQRWIAREFATVVKEIRELDGFATFAGPPSASDLLDQAQAGPIVVFNVSQYRSDALLLTSDGISCLPLPDLTPDVVIGRVISFHQALEAATRGRTSPERAAAEEILQQTLEWLWDAAAGPVLDSLGYLSKPEPGAEWSQIWWVPGGLLSLLPIHAAGHHRRSGSRTVLDRVVSSYTPTVGALRYARERDMDSARPGERRTLIVAMPTTPGLPEDGRLNYALDEVALLSTRLPSPVLLIEPPPSSEPTAHVLPTRQNVLALMGSCQIAHFVCHGYSDPDPSRSRLLLHDHATDPFTVSAMAPISLDRAQLAFLSACGTALTSDALLIDESIHLSSAFQMAGYPRVVGTLWTVNDYVAVRIADAFYSALAESGHDTHDVTRSAWALHQAVRAVRAAVTANPSLWASHIHAGA